VQKTAALLFAGALALAACGGDDNDSSGDASMEAPAAAPSAVDASDGGFVGTADEEAEATSDTGGGFDIGVVGRDVIIEMHVVVSSDNVQRTVSSIMAQASALGGGVASSDVNYGSQGRFGDDQGYAVLVVKVPPESVDSLLAGLDDTGTVQSINQSAQDVTEQLIDLDVRISNARQSVANVREFMDRTENLNELVTLEGELTRRQTELERLEAQQRNLSDRVALSTVTIEVVPTASVPELIDDDSIGDAFEQGWDAFTGFIFGIGYVLALLLPFLVVGAIAASVAWVLVRRRNRRRPAPVSTTQGEQPLPEPTTADVVAQVSSDDESASPPG
jgi:hypothetical protein